MAQRSVKAWLFAAISMKRLKNDLALFGANQLERAQVEMWHRVVEFQGLYAAFQAFRNITAIYQDREKLCGGVG